MAAYTAMDIARYMVNLCIDSDCPVSNLQVQKILYFCQTGYRKKTGFYLFDDDFEAWRYGPVVPSVYKMLSLFGGMKITRRVKIFEEIDYHTAKIIDPIILSNAQKEPWDLVKITHERGSAWDETFKDGMGNGRVISKAMMV